MTGPGAELHGVYFDGRSSRDHPATLHLGEQAAVLVVPSLGREDRWAPAELRVDPAIPGVRRSVNFPGGGRFETRDDAALSAWEARTGRNRGMRRVRGLESRWPTALGALLISGVALWGTLVYGVPAAARQAARVTPPNVLATFDAETMKVLEDQEYLWPSRLPAARQAQLQRAFGGIARQAGGPYRYRLLLRRGSEDVGANAFALPNGTVVMTDQLVALAKSDRELLGVLAHEAGHVTHRHGLAGVYQALGLTLLSTVVTGDLVSAGTFAAAAPAALLQSGYSRQAETESDRVAGQYLMKAYGTTEPLRAILVRLEEDHAREGGAQDSSLLDLIRTHPGTDERVRFLRSLEGAAP